MRSLSSIPRRWLAAAVVFAAATILYAFVWLYYAGWSASVSIGPEWKLAYTPYVEIERVSPNGPADKAELRVGEKLLRVNGYPQHVISMAPAFAHENIALAEGMAEPLEAERRARQERTTPTRSRASCRLKRLPCSRRSSMPALLFRRAVVRRLQTWSSSTVATTA